MRKTSQSIIAILFMFLFAALADASPRVAQEAPARVYSAIVYDLENEAILFEQNADERIPPASLTKVLSMFLALDYMKNGHASASDPIQISQDAAATGGSRMGLKAAESVPLGKLLLGMAVSSGNDASHAVAEAVGGSHDAFVRMMNARASAIGMRNSNFVNPHGLPDPRQYTTARDMLALARAYLLAHPDALALHNTLILEHDGIRTWNKNPLIGQYPGADGLKSGWVRASGYNLIFTAKQGGRRLLAVILGAPDTYLRSAEACRLLDAGFMVCNNEAVTVAAALEDLPVDLTRIDPLKTGREHGLLKRRLAPAKVGKFGRRALGAGVGAERRLLKGAKNQIRKAPGAQAAKSSKARMRRPT